MTGRLWPAILLVGVAMAGCAQEESTVGPHVNVARNLLVTSPSIVEGQRIPDKFTCEGEDVSPALQIKGVPSGTKTLALIMDDPDAPRGTWTHWTAWNLPGGLSQLHEGQNVTGLGAKQGKTSSNSVGYHGPCPPSGTHRYFFWVYALNATLPLAEGASLADLVAALQSKAMGYGVLMGTYSR